MPDDNKEKKKKDDNSILKALSLVSQLGLTLAGCVIVGFLFGRFLDNRLGTAPWLMLVMVFIGAGAAFKILYDLAMDWK
jgi:F0F1-type ATP synthase assembly protein I